MDSNCRNEQPKPFFILNPIGLKYSKRYIMGTNQKSIRLFFRLCNMHVYVDGFVDDVLGGMTLYHKSIYKLEEICDYDSILFVPYSEIEYANNIAICSDPIVVNPEMMYSDIYIYGAGYIGRRVYECLKEKNVVVKGFIDSDSKKENSSLMGVRVYGQDILKSLTWESSIIEAGKYHDEIDSIVLEMNKTVQRFYCIENMWQDDYIYITSGKSFDGVMFIDDIESRKIYLCGKDEDLITCYFDIFKILDFENVYIAKWAEEYADERTVTCCIEDVLWEQEYLIVFCCEAIEKEDLEKLYDMGLERGRDFCDIRCNIWEKWQYIFSSRAYGIQIFDINLAYTRKMQGGGYSWRSNFWK